MGGFKTSRAEENEIMKADDFTFAHDEGIANIGKGLKAILSGDNTDFVIGGKVTAASGLNVNVAPLFIYCSDTKECGVNDEATLNISLASTGSSRIDIIEATVEEENYDSQSRMINDPESGTKNTVKMETKKEVKVTIKSKTGTYENQAPDTDEGYVKLAEIIVGASGSITDDNILNVTAKNSGDTNDSWTNEKDKTYSPMYLTEVFSGFLKEHYEDGAHKENVVHASNLDTGTGGDTVNLSVIPLYSQIETIADVTGVSGSQGATDGIIVIKNHIQKLYPYAESVIGMFKTIEEVDLVSTANVSSLKGTSVSIDGVTATANKKVLLKNQSTISENGLYTVSSGSWSKVYSSKDNYKGILFYAKSGSANVGKMFFISDSQSTASSNIEFSEASLSPDSIPGSWVIRDAEGRFKAKQGVDNEDVATIQDINSLKIDDQAIYSAMDELETKLRNEILGIDSDNTSALDKLQEQINSLQSQIDDNAAQHEIDINNLDKKIAAINTEIDGIVNLKISTKVPDPLEAGDIWLV